MSPRKCLGVRKAGNNGGGHINGPGMSFSLLVFYAYCWENGQIPSSPEKGGVIHREAYYGGSALSIRVTTHYREHSKTDESGGIPR